MKGGTQRRGEKQHEEKSGLQEVADMGKAGLLTIEEMATPWEPLNYRSSPPGTP